MRIRFENSVMHVLVVALCATTFMGCSGSSDNPVPQPDDGNAGGVIDTSGTGNAVDDYPSTVFTAIGDVPYNEEQREGLTALIETHNAKSQSEFVVHVGDIKPGSAPCNEEVYKEVSEQLKQFKSPTFVVLGDNEYNDCENPEAALGFWNQYFLHFNGQWEFQQEVYYQEVRPENFAWTQNAVLFLGLNLVGSSVHDPQEWDQRLAENADYVEEQFKLYGDDIEAAVLFGHANMTEIGPDKFSLFTDRFRAAALSFGKPVLYLQGDGHFWFQNRPWPEENILRVQIEGGANAVQITVDADLKEPFAFDREFLD
ncbi:metallophosphoesterase [Pricia sp. S334]|uniref:Metallophosphoesterase n=1 Tax=Pricia mediterranea TaxID=3076079 RepID=A0ABU3L157_9FLAO|nr:metallophosphoesterase [Pricia sp. S334]MDT7827340.1 metallophosphoesterase [Pricia sp. S334]